MIYDVVILGGGMAGMYAAYHILKISPQTKIVILEKEKYLGGRVYTHRDKYMEVDAGAGRFHDKHYLLLELIDELGLRRRKTPISGSSVFIEHGTGRILNSVFDTPENAVEEGEMMKNTITGNAVKLLDSVEQPALKFGLDIVLGEDTQPSAWLVAKILMKSKQLSADELRNMSFIDFAAKVLSPQEVQFIEDSFGYYSELVIMNAYDATKLMDALSPLNNFYNLKGGMDVLVDALEKKLRKYKSLKIVKNCVAETVDYVPIRSAAASTKKGNVKGGFFGNKTQKMRQPSPQKCGLVHRVVCSDGRVFNGRRAICALPKNALEKMRIFKPVLPLLNKINCGTLCRIYSKYEPDAETGKMWFADLPKSTTNSNLRIIIPIDVKRGVIMVSYTDNKFADYWQKIYSRGGENAVNAQIQKLMEETLQRPIPRPLKTHVFYWKCGVGYWGVGANSDLIEERLLQPYPDQELYICGENISASGQQWIEGALETSRKVVYKMFQPAQSSFIWG